MSLALPLYRAVTGLLEPLAPGLLARRARAGKEDPSRLGERLGRASLPRPPGRLVWLHGVSVGESVSLLPLAQALQARRPDAALLLTSGTVTAAEMLARRLPPGVLHQYAPVDAPGAVDRFLEHWRPDLAVLVESELWPNLILKAKARGTRLALLSARMTEASARGWARAPGAARGLLDAFALILSQDEATTARLRRIGGAPDGRLNLKLAGEPLPCDEAQLASLRSAVATRRVLLAASTHEGEELAIARAWRASGARSLLIIVPRHPERGPAVAEELEAAGFSLTLRSRGEGPASDVYIADTLGELGLFFRLAELTVMGGAFIEGPGGHNPLEPARLGCAIVTGPHVANAAEVYGELAREGAVLQAPDEAGLARLLAALASDPLRVQRLAEAAQAYADRQGAALDDALERLDALLPA